MSDSNRLNMAYSEEATYGDYAGVTELIDLRFTSESLKQDTATKTSDEMRSDRQTADVVRTNISASGDISCELSYGAYDDFFKAALMSAGWSTAVTKTATTLSMASADNSINDSGEGFVTAGFAANQWVKISGFTTSANNGYFKIVSVAVGKMILSGGTVTTEAAGNSVTAKMGAQIVNGTTATSFSIEKQYEDLTDEFAVLCGMMIDSFSLNAAKEAEITTTFGFIGKQEISGTATIGDGNNTAAPSNPVVNCIDNVDGLLEGGSAAQVTGFGLQLSNKLRGRTVIGTLGNISVGMSSMGLTGTLQMYFESKTLMDKYLNFTASGLTLVIVDASGNAYIIDIPRVKYTSGQRVGGGKDQDIIADMAWTAYRNSTEDVTIRIVKFPAA